MSSSDGRSHLPPCRPVGRTTNPTPAVLLALIWILLATAPALAQRTWVVDDTNAAGSDFRTLTEAYQAAAPNDRIHLRYGSGAGYAFPSTFDKPLRLLGIGTQRPIVHYRDVPISCPINTITVLDHVEFRSHRFSPSVEFSRGTTLFSRCYFTPTNVYHSAAYESERVILVDCDVDSPGPALKSFASDLYVLNSRVTSAWANGNLSDAAISTHVTANIQDGGLLCIVGGLVVGGDAWIHCFGSNDLPHPAVQTQGSRVLVAGPAVLLGGRWLGPCGHGTGTRQAEFFSTCAPGSDAGLLDPLAVPPNTWS